MEHKLTRRNFLKISALAMAGSALAACTSTTINNAATTTQAATSSAANNAAAPVVSATGLGFNNKAWKYDATNNVYYQIGLQYCTKPETTAYETLGIYVPGAYLTATANGDGTYTGVVNQKGSVNGFTAATAPMVFPVNTPGYSAQKAPTAYSYAGLASYLKAGFIYVYAGLRGRSNGYDANKKLIYSGGAPWGVTDLKAAVRYIRYNQSVLPGNPDSIFVFGVSGGGAQSSVMGASGDSKLYTPYLEAIGAAMKDANGQPINDAISGVMAWVPITSLDYADEAYEWNMGQYASTGTRAATTFTSALSKDLATAYAEYINKLGLKDPKGNVLTLDKSESGIYASGSYYGYLKSTIETSLNNFLADTHFPYTKAARGGMPGGMPPSGGPPPDMQQGGAPPVGDQAAITSTGNMTATVSSTTYQTVQEYIASLNKDKQWVAYDVGTNTASITSVADFVTCCKLPSKNVAAFDDLKRAQAENDVFGNDERDSLHFDPVLADLLAKNKDKYAAFSDWDAAYVAAYATDLKALDKFGSSIASRMNMYNPMYYLLASYAGYQTTTVAKHWRIRTGIEQGDTANTVEMNLALALQNYNGVSDVDFATVWNQGHTDAERNGSSSDNFIAWVTKAVKA